ncbi:C-factor-like [Biomphalaria glabrata]|uniref:C-factor-like n=1 Tax=Biomphalaria glabrata TaxID=6526 RepID=A0A9U8DUU0_BIOGL|nr:C-factor-like [Biomphalaria glabrata]
MPLTARTILITGASRGLGLEFVKQIVKSSTPPEVVIATCRNPEKAVDLQNIAQGNPILKVIKLDVETDDDLESAFQETKAAVGDLGLNLLINNAGIYDKGKPGTLADISRESMQNHFNINVSGPIAVAQKFLPLIKQAASQSNVKKITPNKAGIIMVSSIMGSQQLTYKDGNGACLHYKCSKTAITMASILMARELKVAGIFVAALHPGWVRTDMGTSQAPLSPEESIEACLNVIGNAGEDVNGKLISFTGDILPY